MSTWPTTTLCPVSVAETLGQALITWQPHFCDAPWPKNPPMNHLVLTSRIVFPTKSWEQTTTTLQPLRWLPYSTFECTVVSHLPLISSDFHPEPSEMLLWYWKDVPSVALYCHRCKLKITDMVWKRQLLITGGFSDILSSVWSHCLDMIWHNRVVHWLHCITGFTVYNYTFTREVTFFGLVCLFCQRDYRNLPAPKLGVAWAKEDKFLLGITARYIITS